MVPTSGVVRHNVTAYVLLACGAIWLITAMFLYGKSFGIVWRGDHVPDVALWVFRWVLPVLFLGWIAPVSFGAWLLWRK